MGLDLDKDMSGFFLANFSLMLSNPHMRQNYQKTSLRFPCLSQNPIIDSINLLCVLVSFFIASDGIELAKMKKVKILRNNKREGR